MECSQIQPADRTTAQVALCFPPTSKGGRSRENADTPTLLQWRIHGRLPFAAGVMVATRRMRATCQDPSRWWKQWSSARPARGAVDFPPLRGENPDPSCCSEECRQQINPDRARHRRHDRVGLRRAQTAADETGENGLVMSGRGRL